MRSATMHASFAASAAPCSPPKSVPVDAAGADYRLTVWMLPSAQIVTVDGLVRSDAWAHAEAARINSKPGRVAEVRSRASNGQVAVFVNRVAGDCDLDQDDA